MIDSVARAQQWLMESCGSFWTWDEHGEAIQWSDGHTIVFRQELTTILERLVPQGLPPFNSLLLLLAATQQSWPEGERMEGIYTLLNLMIPIENSYRLDDLVSRLNRVHRIREALDSAEAKAELAALVFEGASDLLGPNVGNQVVNLIRDELPSNIYALEDSPSLELIQSRLFRGLAVLNHCLTDFEPDSLTLRRKTGLDVDVQPADVEVPIGEAVRSLLSAFEEDDELYHLATLTRRLMAALTLPRNLTQPEELPLGGVSDLTNRGDLDRLLLSELAYDDLTLAVRIANNEALYYRRESPPESEARQRILILDSGIRTWGAPRVFIMAVALALAATTEEKHEFSCYRVEADDLIPVDLRNIEGTREHLSVLRHEAHPGQALPTLEALIHDSTAVDLVMVTTEDTEADADFRECLSTVEITPMMLATVNREGDFHLEKVTTSGRKTMRRVKLDLEPVLADKRRKPKPIIDESVPLDRPAILGVKPFPLLLSHSIHAHQFWEVEGWGYLAVTYDHRLMHWHKLRGLGGFQICDDVPKTHLHWAQERPIEGIVHAVVGNRKSSPLYVLKIDLNEMTCTACEVTSCPKAFRAVTENRGAILVMTERKIFGFSLSSGELLGEQRTANFFWCNDRAYSNGDDWCIAIHDRGQIALEFVVAGDVLPASPIGIVDSQFREGPIAVLDDGSLFDVTEKEMIYPEILCYEEPKFFWFLGASRDGNRINLGHSIGRVARVEVDRNLMAEGYGSHHPENLELYPLGVGQQNLRNRFRAIGTSPGIDSFRLLGRQAKDCDVYFYESEESICSGLIQPEGPSLVWDFESIRSPTGHGKSWKLAKLPGGRLVFLDPRGMLHLKHPKSSLPEVTLVLVDDERISGWCSDGTIWGDAYFIGDSENGHEEARRIWFKVIVPFFEID